MGSLGRAELTAWAVPLVILSPRAKDLAVSDGRGASAAVSARQGIGGRLLRTPARRRPRGSLRRRRREARRSPSAPRCPPGAEPGQARPAAAAPRPAPDG